MSINKAFLLGVWREGKGVLERFPSGFTTPGRIPTAKDELFAYSLDWSIVDQVCSRVRVVSLFVKAAFCFRDPRQDRGN